MLYDFCLLFCLFLIYSFIGWIIDIMATFYSTKKFNNRGFLMGPYCPIYGFGAISMLILLNNYGDVLTLFVMGALICSFLEYFTSYVMEKIFKTRWWDYYNMPFNVNGRICLVNSIGFGILGVLLIFIINPFFLNIISDINIVFFIPVTIILFGLFLTDCVISFNIINKIQKTASLVVADSTNEISAKVRKSLSKKSFVFKRVFNAFPNLNIIGYMKNKR